MSEQDGTKGRRISRRSMMAATGAVLAGGLVGSRATVRDPEQAPKGAAQKKAAAAGTATASFGFSDWVCDDGFRNATRGGKRGFVLSIRITGYRGLPLNVIAGIELKVDGETIDPKGMILRLHNRSYRLEELPRLGPDWRDVPEFFVLDTAELFVPRTTPLAAGEHLIEGRLFQRGIFGTAGRGDPSRGVPITKRLVLETD